MTLTLALWLAALAAGAQTPAFEVDRSQSYIIAITDKAGLFGFAGHKHAILAREWKAIVTYSGLPARASVSAGAPPKVHVEMRIPTASLVIDSPEALELAGLKDSPKPEDVKKIQKQMLAPDNLAAAQYPEITFISGPTPYTENFLMQGALTIRGKSNDITVQVRREPLPDVFTFARVNALRLTGEFTIKQSDYGIKPASVGGVVKVKDEVKIRFVIVARANEGK